MFKSELYGVVNLNKTDSNGIVAVEIVSGILQNDVGIYKTGDTIYFHKDNKTVKNNIVLVNKNNILYAETLDKEQILLEENK